MSTLPLTIINDCHVGAVRAAGTTPFTAWQLRQYLLESFYSVIDMVPGSLVILGDLFDTGHVGMADLLGVWHKLRRHVSSGAPLYLVQGNHDLEKNLTVLSSFQFLCKLLVTEFPGQVTVVDAPMRIHTGAYIIPHLANQDLFDAALAQVPECHYLLVHCNYHNGFAAQSDHSLNLSQDQALRLPVKHIIFAHEHQARTALGGKVFVAGNQHPSSVADCLGNDVKSLTLLHPEGAPERFQTWQAKGEFAEQDWRALTDSGEKFIRVVGEATAAEAADVVTAIAKFRNKSKALVITNATSVEGVADGEQIQMNMEQVKAFDVLSALLECLDEREQGVVQRLLKFKEPA